MNDPISDLLTRLRNAGQAFLPEVEMPHSNLKDTFGHVRRDTRSAMDTEVAMSETMPMERLEAEITELAGHMAAAECRWLLLVGEFDRRRGYESWGCRTCSHWLSWHCGLDLRAARERFRVPPRSRRFRRSQRSSLQAS